MNVLRRGDLMPQPGLLNVEEDVSLVLIFAIRGQLHDKVGRQRLVTTARGALFFSFSAAVLGLLLIP
jgi:hypothetical protein